MDFRIENEKGTLKSKCKGISKYKGLRHFKSKCKGTLESICWRNYQNRRFKETVQSKLKWTLTRNLKGN